MRWLGAALAALVLAACGSDGTARPALRDEPDAAFVVRLHAQQQTGAQLVGSVDGQLREPAARRLLQPMRELRERGLARLEPHRAALEELGPLANLGVSPEAAAEDVMSRALDGVHPLTPAFLATMVRHDAGAIALARAELERGRDPDLKAVARAVIVEYTDELASLDRAIAALQAR